jgi:hypothetical protein
MGLFAVKVSTGHPVVVISVRIGLGNVDEEIWDLGQERECMNVLLFMGRLTA